TERPFATRGPRAFGASATHQFPGDESGPSADRAAGARCGGRALTGPTRIRRRASEGCDATAARLRAGVPGTVGARARAHHDLALQGLRPVPGGALRCAP